MTKFSFIMFLISIVIGIIVYLLNWIWKYPRFNIPSHLLHHRVINDKDFIQPHIGKALLETVKDIGYQEGYFTNLDADTKTAYAGSREHIGEGIAINDDGSCNHRYLFPNPSKTLCILPGRVDVGRHFVSFGGPDAIREPFDEMIARTSSFAKYFKYSDDMTTPSLEHDDASSSTSSKAPSTSYLVQELFNSEKFQKVAKYICPADAQVLDPFQFTFIIQVPGQTVPLHVDAPYYWGAGRTTVPQWLLAAMTFSDLFHDQFIHQVQVVGYLHEWQTRDESDSGDFIFYNDEPGTMSSFKSHSLSGNAVDGSKLVHAARIYETKAKVPIMDKTKQTILKYHPTNDSWNLYSDNDVLQSYRTDDLRITIVYRARCFESMEQIEKFRDPTRYDQLSVEKILEVFLDDLQAKKLITSENRNSISKFDLSDLIIATYIKYPLPDQQSAFIPYNYCIVTKVAPWLKPLLSFFC